MTTPPPVPPRAQGRNDEEASKPLPLQLELPGPKPAAAATSEAPSKGATRGSWSRALAIALGGLGLLAALAAALAEWALPWYVRRECIEAAAAHGIDLSVESAELSPEGFRLVGVRATSAAVAQGRAQAHEVEVQTSGLRPRKLTVRGAEVTLRGRVAAVGDDFARWRASQTGGQSGEWAPASVVVDDARVVWQAAMGESVRIEAAGVHAQVVWRDADGGGGARPALELHARSDEVAVKVTGATSLGPWRVDVDRTPGSSRLRVAFDPGVPDACTLLVVGDGEHTTSLDLVAPRVALTHLGIPEEALGIGGKGIQVEASLHYTALGPARADVRAKGGLYGLGALPLMHSTHSMDVNWEGTASGDPSRGVDVKNARLAVGPLVGPLTGTLKKFEDGFRLDLAWAAGPVPCEAFAIPLGLGQPFDIGYELAKVAPRGPSPSSGQHDGRSAAAAARSKAGLVSGAVLFSFDSRDLGATKVEFTRQVGDGEGEGEGCGASFFQ